MSSSDRVRYVLLIAFIPFLDNTIIPHIILNIYSSYLIYAILVKNKDYFVLTTNVDHCFQKAGFEKNCKILFLELGVVEIWIVREQQ